MSRHESERSAHDRLVSALQARWPENRIGPGLGREKALLDLLGSPERAYPVIQIAGTNGKGSTAIMIESLLRAAGLRVGRYSSPHLVDVRERICVDGSPISAETFDAVWEQISPMVAMVDEQRIDGIEMTFFEVITAMAFATFADAPVDVAVVEVGLGGRWDATNVADAQVAVVTPVAMDHMHILGDTLDKIAAEKAGIIKPGCSAVISGQKPEAAAVLLAQCTDVGVQPVLEGPDYALLERRPALGGQVIRIEEAGGPLGELYLPLFGEHMAHNAAQAVAAVEAFLGGKPLNPEIIEQGLSQVRAEARLEVVRRSPTIILDTFHNPHGAHSAMDGLRESFDLHPLIAVVAAMRDKDIDGVMSEMAEDVDRVVLTTMPELPRALPVDELEGKASTHWDADHRDVESSVAGAVEQAIRIADASGPGAGILIAGSVILAGQARAILLPDGVNHAISVPQAVVETPDLSDEEITAMEGQRLEAVDDDPDPADHEDW
ncbi:bifunctional folylpolyglutamate synthase/dihydrofolate synthase [Acidipropionibacterium acidipropionici]|uniref:bifunctional folylpolyglutamate synthase/dihydrofolate synthase n=1 Tax=Acidipropionibacterium acidipropionici TaxID=1748 RepID=UPI0003F692F2|nr:folylpolyglutamate synthase/dihydrofolate synthase family protein [Acidipropionibacterium acidipropionici]ALN16286.1 bifunctional folylpolyglutamate synthase/dihydrofolate synthase [Acidipropionibacterium acidipropionici]APZ07966.1 bifunctional folylpolyglutamate synthase/dihydrofolate synthase [Acidipropionibacterium acidipropionici]